MDSNYPRTHYEQEKSRPSKEPRRIMKQNNRVGKLLISAEFIDQGMLPKIFFKIQFTVIKCEHMYHKNMFEYYGTSPQFSEIDMCGIIPTYDLTLENNDFFKLERIKYE
jgi:hypothetical protein